MQGLNKATLPLWPASNYKGWPIMSCIVANSLRTMYYTVLGIEVISSERQELIVDAIDKYVDTKKN